MLTNILKINKFLWKKDVFYTLVHKKDSANQHASFVLTWTGPLKSYKEFWQEHVHAHFKGWNGLNGYEWLYRRQSLKTIFFKNKFVWYILLVHVIGLSATA